MLVVCVCVMVFSACFGGFIFVYGIFLVSMYCISSSVFSSFMFFIFSGYFSSCCLASSSSFGFIPSFSACLDISWSSSIFCIISFMLVLVSIISLIVVLYSFSFIIVSSVFIAFSLSCSLILVSCLSRPVMPSLASVLGVFLISSIMSSVLVWFDSFSACSMYSLSSVILSDSLVFPRILLALISSLRAFCSSSAIIIVSSSRCFISSESLSGSSLFMIMVLPRLFFNASMIARLSWGLFMFLYLPGSSIISDVMVSRTLVFCLDASSIASSSLDALSPPSMLRASMASGTLLEGSSVRSSMILLYLLFHRRESSPLASLAISI